MSAGGIMNVFPERPYRMLIANTASSVVNIAKRHRFTITRPPSVQIIRHKAAEHFSYSASLPLPSSVNVVHYKPDPDRHQQVHQQNDRSAK